MGTVLYSLGIILGILGILGVIVFGTAERRRRYPSYGRLSMWLFGIGVVLLLVGLAVAGRLF